jgi:hypothetical protein
MVFMRLAGYQPESANGNGFNMGGVFGSHGMAVDAGSCEPFSVQIPF